MHVMHLVWVGKSDEEELKCFQGTSRSTVWWTNKCGDRMVYVFVHHFGYFIVSPDPDRTYADSWPVAAASLNRIMAAGRRKTEKQIWPK